MQTRSLPEPLRLASADPSVHRLPPLDAPSEGAELGPAQRRIVVAAIVALHLLAVWGLLQVQAVRDTALQVAPILVDLLAPPAPPLPVPPQRPVAKTAPTPPKPQTLPRPQPPQQAPVLTTQATAPPESYTVPQPDPAPSSPAPATSVAPVAADPAAAAPAPPARVLPDAAVQYIEPPQVEYPRPSVRRGEHGLVIVRAYVGSGGGAPHPVQVERSSGHVRLDQAALAAVHKARFKPYAEAGRPVEGWALIPIRFELEK